MGVKERKAREFKKREEEILLAAYELLIELEPIQMTMEMIAEKTEIGRGTIYKHFKSKDEIYAHLILARRNEFIEKLNLLKIPTPQTRGISTSYPSQEGNLLEQNLLKKLIQSYIDYSTKDIKAFVVHKKCLNHYLKSNINNNLIELMKLQENKKISLLESIMKDALNELSVNPDNIRYLIYAGWGMLRGAMDFMLENRDLLIEDKEKFQFAIEQIFLHGLGINQGGNDVK